MSDPSVVRMIDELLNKGKIVCFTDGSCLNNPGAGGVGVLLLFKKNGRIYEREISQGFKLTTNNRMELLAIILAIEAVKIPTPMAIFSDSRYVIDAINKGWAAAWQRRGWKKADKKPASNADLWARLLDLLSADMEFFWVKGHNNQRENERVDKLARGAASGPDLGVDVFYQNQSK